MRPCRSGVGPLDSIRRLNFSSGVLALAMAAGCTSTSQVSGPTPNTKCTISATASTTEFAPEGGSSQLTIDTSRDCVWEVTSNAEWVALTSDSRGQGSGTVNFSVRSSTDPVARNAILKVVDQQVTLRQRAAPCRYELSRNQASLPASGGSGRIDVTASSPLCEWIARPEAAWISIEPSGPQRGNAAFSYEALSWSGPPRRGDIVVGDRRVVVSQTNGCAYNFGPFVLSVGAAGGAGSIDVQTTDGCSWTAASNVSWMTVNGSSSGSGAASFNVSVNTGPTRTGTLMVAERTFTVIQESGCRYAVNPSTATLAAEGGRAQIGVTAAAGCGWTATSDTGWIGIAGGAPGVGNGAVQIAAPFNPGPQRTAAVHVANQAVTITQPSGCWYTISLAVWYVAWTGAPGYVNVDAPPPCAWSATSNVPWIAIVAGPAGTGPGTVFLQAHPNFSFRRTGTVTIAGHTFTVTQDGL
jgi:Viral BACON domain